jgi:hypothetical protein
VRQLGALPPHRAISSLPAVDFSFNGACLTQLTLTSLPNLEAVFEVFSPSRRRSLDVGCKYHHISNANLSNESWHGLTCAIRQVSFFRR